MHEREHQQDENETDCLKQLSVDDAIEELIYFLLQAGDHVCKQAAYHLPPQRDLTYVFDRNGGTKQRSDMNRQLDSAVERGTLYPE